MKKGATRATSREVFVILHNIRSTHNVGSIFRTADAAGVSKIFLTGYTSTPHDKFGRPRKDIAKVALGAENTVSWEYAKSTAALIKKLRAQKVHIVAIEQSPHAIDYKKVRPQYPIALIYGNEVDGVPPSILAACDTIAHIPMLGSKESLNVSVAAGITLFGIAAK